MKKYIGMSLVLTLLLVGCDNPTNEQAGELEKSVSDSVKVTDEKTEQKEESYSEESKKNNSETLTTKNNAGTNTSSVGEKEKYIKKLDDIKKSLGEFDKTLETGTQFEIGQAYGEIFTRWDKALNDIYGALDKQISSSEMDMLREEQREWIEYRDESAKKESLKYEGGTMQSLEYISTQAKITEERCYELVEGYMK